MNEHIHTKTGFGIGNPAESPLAEADAAQNRATGALTRDLETALTHTILSASGWRRVFAESGGEEDATSEIGKANTVLAAHMANVYADFIIARTGKTHPVVALGIDTRPTGRKIADCMVRALLSRGITVHYLFITAACEIMAYSRGVDGFVYISASHNPIGHNGVKFGLNDGGVISAKDAAPLADALRSACGKPDAVTRAVNLVTDACSEDVAAVFDKIDFYKEKALAAYRDFTRVVISGEESEQSQAALFDAIKANVARQPLGIVCDMNGSARTLSIDEDFLRSLGIRFYGFNNKAGEIAHAIIPEAENLVYCARETERLQQSGEADALLGYMPDCDGDRGNIVYWDAKEKAATVLKAQEVFALSVMAETAYLAYQGRLKPGTKAAVAVNDPTSMRIDRIAAAFGLAVFRAEVGEANVVNLAREKRAEGYTVRILGEGSNGGNITYPAAVRDPLNTIFAIIKLLVLRDTGDKLGLFHLWCRRSNQESAYRNDFTLSDVLKTLPPYTTTGVSEPRAITHIKTSDHAALKGAYQKVFEEEWAKKKDELAEKYGICSYEAICNNATSETRNVTDFSVSGKGGLKILFKDKNEELCAFVWMRGSGTEPVFRVMCDVKGNAPQTEHELLAWHTAMIQKADTEIN